MSDEKKPESNNDEIGERPSGHLQCGVMHEAPKRMAILRLTPEAIRDLLHLPDKATLIEMRIPFDAPGTMEVKVEGVGWEAPEGSVIAFAEAAIVTRDENGVIDIDWRLPKNA